MPYPSKDGQKTAVEQGTKTIINQKNIQMNNFLIRLKFLFTGDCSHGCGFEEKFGCFVPEAGCPIHDYSPFIN